MVDFFRFYQDSLVLATGYLIIGVFVFKSSITTSFQIPILPSGGAGAQSENEKVKSGLSIL